METAGIGWGDLLRVLGALAVLLPLAYVTARSAGSRLAMRSGRAMRLVDTLPLGPGRALYLVEVAGRMLVIGASGQQIERLATVSDPEKVAELRRHVVTSPFASGVGYRRHRGRGAGDSSSTDGNPHGLS